MIYDCISAYIEDAADLEAKVARYEAVIEGLGSAALKAAESAHLDEYMLDDGQSKLKTVYRSPAAIASAIDVYERLKQRCVNQLNGRIVNLRNARNLPRFR